MVECDRDFYGWATEQAAFLRAGRLDAVDLANVAEEIESMGRSKKRELVNRLAVLLAHSLKWQFQPALRGKRWRLTIVEQRRRLAMRLKDNPSLKPQLGEACAEAYELALLAAERETDLPGSAFSAMKSWTLAQVVEDGFWLE